MWAQPHDSQVIEVRPYIFPDTKILIYRPVRRMQNVRPEPIPAREDLSESGELAGTGRFVGAISLPPFLKPHISDQDCGQPQHAQRQQVKCVGIFNPNV